MTESKEQSLPKNWPRPTPEDLELKPNRIVNVGIEQDYLFCNNSIKTSKYEYYNFFPRFLLEEFNPKQKIANCYFLIISGMQVIPAITNTNGYPTTLIPLFFVLLISGIFKVMEDLERHKSDRLANSSPTLIFNREIGTFEESLWSDIQVGDLVKVNAREIIPADMVVFQVCEPNPDAAKGICYVETKSLDGETNLKMRNVLPCLLGKVMQMKNF